MDEKTDLRIRFKNLRKTQDLEFLSETITANIRNMDVYKSARDVMIYYPTKYEIDILELLQDKDKNFYLPRVNDSELLVCPYQAGDLLEKSQHNIMEPMSIPISPDDLDLIIVPALAADENKYRLGYGGGFYDRFLAAFKNPPVTIVPVSSLQVVECLPVEEFDIPADYVVTELKSI